MIGHPEFRRRDSQSRRLLVDGMEFIYRGIGSPFHGTDLMITGYQIAAGRMLLGMNQRQFTTKLREAGFKLSLNSLCRIERAGHAQVRCHADTLMILIRVFQSCGVAFVNPQPGTIGVLLTLPPPQPR